ncbi:MAG: hypothetical protein U0359_10785 [Byssovorax sp.]
MIGAAVLGVAVCVSACSSAPPAATPAPVPSPTGKARSPRLRPGLRLPATAIARRPKEPAAPPPRIDPDAQKVLLDRLAGPAVPVSTAAPPPVTAVGLQSTAEGETEGLREDGPIAFAELAEGQRFELARSLPAGSCVTFVAQGGLGTSEVDLFLGAGDPKKPEILAADDQEGPVAVLGGRRGCFRQGRPGELAVTLYVVLRKGTGPVLVQGFRRDGATPSKK